MTEQLQLREAIDMAQVLGTVSELQPPLLAKIGDVTGVTYFHKPLNLTSRFPQDNDKVSLCFGIHTTANAEDLIAHANKVEKSALSEDFPETVSLFFLSKPNY